jgi:hypothetical protein
MVQPPQLSFGPDTHAKNMSKSMILLADVWPIQIPDLIISIKGNQQVAIPKR